MKTFLKVSLWAAVTLMTVLMLSACSAEAATEAPADLATAQPTEATTEAPTDLATVQPTESVPTISRTIKAGSSNEEFTPYTIVVPAGWTDTHWVGEGAVDVLVLTLDEGPFPPSVTIHQRAGDSGQCHFAGETGEGQVFPEAGISIIGTASEFMRGGSFDKRSWTICEKGSDTFSFPTTYGYITYDTHMPWGAILAEMDAMVASLAVAQ